MKRLAVLNVVGLSESLLGPATPRLNAFRNAGSFAHIRPALPAVTCTAQSNYLTGTTAARARHRGQRLVQSRTGRGAFLEAVEPPRPGAEDLGQRCAAELPGFTCAQLFWWFNMYSSGGFHITPRPMYPADGRKFFDIYTWPYRPAPGDQARPGRVSVLRLLGPGRRRPTPQGAPDATTRWIAEAAKWVERRHAPTLNLVYLPHLDYNLQRLGPGHPADRSGSARALTPSSATCSTSSRAAASSDGAFRVRNHRGQPARASESRLPRARLAGDQGRTRSGIARCRREPGLRRGRPPSRPHLRQRPTLLGEVRAALERTPGVGEVWGPEDKRARGLDHPRAGDLVAVAAPRSLVHLLLLAGRRAVHRTSPAPWTFTASPATTPWNFSLTRRWPCPRRAIAWRLLQKSLGFRMLMDLIPLDATLVKGSHGALPADRAEYPIAIAARAGFFRSPDLDSTAIHDTLRRLIQG